MGWRVELTQGAESSLRALAGPDRAAVIARIDGLAKDGLPGGVRHEVNGVESVVLLAGGQALFCLEKAGEGRIVVIAVRAFESAAVSGAVSPERSHGRSRGGMMDSVLQDLRFAARSLVRSRGFAIAAVLTLAAGIGAAAAIFSVANGVLLRPLPWSDPDEVITLWTSWDNFPDKTWVSIPEYQLFHQENRTLDDLALYGTTSTTFTTVDNPERVGAAFVTPNIFDVLGVSPVVGRTFTWEEASRESLVGVLLSWSVWQRRYGGDRGITERTVELNGEAVPVLGVLPEGFALPEDYGTSSASDVFYPNYVDIESPAPDLGTGGSHGFYGVGRLRDGMTVEDARADFARIMTGVQPVGMYSPERRFTPKLFDAKADIVGSSRTTILVLLGAVGFVLLIACGNVANLLLSRSETRRGEVAVRLALGAGRGRILRQLMTENLVLAIAAGVLGYFLAFAGVRLLLSIDPDAVPRAASVALDAPVMLFTLLLSLFTVLLFGAIPALRMSRGLAAGIRAAGRSGRLSGSSRMQGLLVASQMAMAVILLTGSVLLIRTFVGLLRIDPGFHAQEALTLRISTPAATYPDAASIDRFYSELLRRIREIPGVRTAGAARLLPLASTMGDSFFRPANYVPGQNESTQADWQWATADYIETMGIPLLEGRTFDERDVRGAPPVVMINEVVARRFWGNESPIGQRVLASGALPDTATVIGVVGNVSHNGITTEVKTRYYVPHAQVNDNFAGTMRSMTLTIATEGPPLRYLEPVRREIRASDPSVAISEIQTLDEVLSASVAQPRFAMVLLAVFAIVALSLSIVGIYGVLAYGVSKRTREIGVRMALGARTGQVVGLVVRQGMMMAIGGVLVGSGLAFAMSGLMSGLLYGVSPQDPTTFVSVTALFAGVALLACWIPALRAARIRPGQALRHEGG